MDRPLRIYLWLAFGITWGVGGLALLGGAYRADGGPGFARALHYIAAFGPSLAGVIMASRVPGGVRALLARALPTRAGLPWYFIAVIGFLAANLVAATIQDRAYLANLPSASQLLLGVPALLARDTGPLGEEFGWRGFALPRMLERWSPIKSALILGVIWWAWHLPTFFIATLSQSHLSIPLFVVNSVALSVIMTWLYLRTGGDLLLMILFHAAANYTSAIGVSFEAEVAVEVAVAAAMLGMMGQVRRHPPES